MMKKNLNVDAMILDLRNVQEDFLDRYEQIKLDCMIALTSPRVQALLSQHNISLDSMLCKNVPEEVSVATRRSSELFPLEQLNLTRQWC